MKHTMSFAVMFSKTSRWDVSGFSRVEWRWPASVLKPLGAALVRVVKEFPDSMPRRDIPIIEKISFAGELTLTAPEDRLTYKGRLFKATSGQLIYSKIRVKQGSLCVVPSNTKAVGVSTEYPVFEIRSDVALGAYLELALRTPMFQKQLHGLAHGGDTKTRIDPDQFLGIELPIPSISAQRAIISHWQQAQAEIAGMESSARRIEHEASAKFLDALGISKHAEKMPSNSFALKWSEVQRWSFESTRRSAAVRTYSSSRYPMMLGTECLASVSHGCSASPSDRPTQLKILKISAVTRGRLDLAQWKHAPNREELRQRFALRDGDVLLCRTNGTLDYVGMSALVERDQADFIFPDKLIRVRCRPTLLPAFLWRLLQLPVMRTQIEAAARTAVGNYAIGTTDLWRFKYPLPPPEVQAALVADFAKAAIRADALRTQAYQRRKSVGDEVEAMVLGSLPVTDFRNQQAAIV